MTPRVATYSRFVLLSVLTFANTPSMPSAHACLNDSDTLAIEARAIQNNTSGLPNVVRVITGRFERNPARYYEMRLSRVQREIGANPAKLALYDDAAVAADRLHRSIEALRWMEKKRQQLNVSQLSAKEKHEHWYRYYANAGTFHAHQWIRSGANRGDTGELKQGRDMIVRAIQIKPNAHFGREKYQLKYMEWLLNPPAFSPESAPDFLGISEMNGMLNSSPYRDAVTGLSGLIVLGDAWASFDIYYALANALAAQGKYSLATLAGQRCLDLLDNGRGSLSPYAQKQEPILRYAVSHVGEFEASEELSRAHYFELRDDAIGYQQSRLNYMNGRFKEGLHPDTNPGFWDNWDEPPLPSLESRWEQERAAYSRASIRSTTIALLLSSVTFLIGNIMGRRKVRRAEAERDDEPMES